MPGQDARGKIQPEEEVASPHFYGLVSATGFFRVAITPPASRLYHSNNITVRWSSDQLGEQ
jgi:hypothetical protein